MSDDLIKRLRDRTFLTGSLEGLAANRIEELEKELSISRIEELLEERERVIKASNDMFCVMSDSLNTAHAKLAKAVEALRSFKLTCNESSVYKDCTLHFVEPHALSLRLNIGSDKAFIVADFEARRRAVLAELEKHE
jgi:hypothetical protein